MNLHLNMEFKFEKLKTEMVFYVLRVLNMAVKTALCLYTSRLLWELLEVFCFVYFLLQWLVIAARFSLISHLRLNRTHLNLNNSQKGGNRLTGPNKFCQIFLIIGVPIPSPSILTSHVHVNVYLCRAR